MRKGSGLEYLIDVANDAYLRKGIARIKKTEAPVKIMKKEGNKILLGYIQGKAQLDFVGVVKGGLYIEFDTKETKLTSLPLKNIESHQVETIKAVLAMHGLAFILAEVNHKYYVIDGTIVVKKYETWLKNRGVRGFGNIGVGDMVEVRAGSGFVLDYLMTALSMRKEGD